MQLDEPLSRTVISDERGRSLAQADCDALRLRAHRFDCLPGLRVGGDDGPFSLALVIGVGLCHDLPGRECSKCSIERDGGFIEHGPELIQAGLTDLFVCAAVFRSAEVIIGTLMATAAPERTLMMATGSAMGLTLSAAGNRQRFHVERGPSG